MLVIERRCEKSLFAVCLYLPQGMEPKHERAEILLPSYILILVTACSFQAAQPEHEETVGLGTKQC